VRFIAALCIGLQPIFLHLAGVLSRTAGRKRYVRQQQLPDRFDIGAGFARSFGHDPIMAANGKPR